MTGTTTAADYTWLEEQYEGLMQAYCVTLVKGISPDGLLHELGAESVLRVTGVEALFEPSCGAGEGYRGDLMFVGVAAVGDWSLMVEYNGYVGIREAAMGPVSRGRTVVSHFRNVNAVDYFYWFEDGDLRLRFEPLFPSLRNGSHPDELLTEMRESGFDLTEDDKDRDFDGHTEAAFALAHRLTGVHLTPELFESLDFTCGLISLP
ncbi:DUF6461 domain-containing protein [Streptomyces graminilatus]|uniref:DUF6461 domain-containing protein n=1 Tax=Streptomyces graminilatus TaxID=1464070 RepID=UPI0006E3AE67|nr:DUF6461 domain-containing protein [Streptomyces graminilatus]